MRKNAEQIFEELRAQGKKLTKTRKAIIEMLYGSHRLLSAQEVQSELKKLGINVNKTSVYRELEFLADQGIIQEINTNQRASRYEFALGPHHHHLVCTGCGDAEDIKMPELETPMQKIETKVIRKGFVVKDHSIELYGLCTNCK